MGSDQFSRLAEFLRRLEAAKISYRLDSFRSGSVAVHVVVPGERWEVEFMEQGGIEVERFTSDGTILDELALEQLLQTFSD